MIGGILKRIRQSGEVARVSAHVVHENDQFTVSYGFDEDVTHVPPPLDKPRGKPIGAYATAVLKDGSKLLEVMSLEQIEQVRKVSRAANNGPWVAWWSEMARKTVMRRLSKRLPMSTDIEDEIFQRDDTMRTEPGAVQTIEAEPSAPAPLSRLDAIEYQIAPEPEAEPPVEPEVITEQAEALEGEIVDEGEQTDAFGLPPIDEQPAEKTPAEEAVEKVIAEMDKAKTSAALEKIITDAEPHKAFMPDELAMKLEIAASQNRTRLEAKAEEPAK
jgi:recombination protein RecT